MVPDYSIVIPAYNEEACLPTCLAAVRSSMARCRLRGEVIVVDNNSTDATPDLARAAGARVLFEAVNQISRARNAGARIARGRHLIFLDADTTLDREHLLQALAALGSGRVCGGGTVVAFDGAPGGAGRWGLWLWNRLSRRLRWGAGCFLFCPRAGYRAVRGFSEEVYISEEVGFSRRLRAWGRARGQAFVILPRPIVSSGRKLHALSLRHLLLTNLTLLLGPIGVRSRRLCSLWYDVR